MDKTAKLWDVNTGKEYATLADHTGEIVTIHFNADGDKLITGSFDATAKIWDVRKGICLLTLE